MHFNVAHTLCLRVLDVCNSVVTGWCSSIISVNSVLHDVTHSALSCFILIHLLIQICINQVSSVRLSDYEWLMSWICLCVCEAEFDWHQMRQTELIHWLLVDFLLYYNSEGVAMEMWPQIILAFHPSYAALFRSSRTGCDVTADEPVVCWSLLLMPVWVKEIPPQKMCLQGSIFIYCGRSWDTKYEKTLQVER